MINFPLLLLALTSLLVIYLILRKAWTNLPGGFFELIFVSSCIVYQLAPFFLMAFFNLPFYDGQYGRLFLSADIYVFPLAILSFFLLFYFLLTFVRTPSITYAGVSPIMFLTPVYRLMQNANILLRSFIVIGIPIVAYISYARLVSFGGFLNDEVSYSIPLYVKSLYWLAKLLAFFFFCNDNRTVLADRKNPSLTLALSLTFYFLTCFLYGLYGHRGPIISSLLSIFFVVIVLSWNKHLNQINSTFSQVLKILPIVITTIVLCLELGSYLMSFRLGFDTIGGYDNKYLDFVMGQSASSAAFFDYFNGDCFSERSLSIVECTNHAAGASIETIREGIGYSTNPILQFYHYLPVLGIPLLSFLMVFIIRNSSLILNDKNSSSPLSKGIVLFYILPYVALFGRGSFTGIIISVFLISLMLPSKLRTQ